MKNEWRDREQFFVVETANDSKHIPECDATIRLADSGEYAHRAADLAKMATIRNHGIYAYSISWSLSHGIRIHTAFRRGELDASALHHSDANQTVWASLLFPHIAEYLDTWVRATTGPVDDPLLERIRTEKPSVALPHCAKHDEDYINDPDGPYCVSCWNETDIGKTINRLER